MFLNNWKIFKRGTKQHTLSELKIRFPKCKNQIAQITNPKKYIDLRSYANLKVPSPNPIHSELIIQFEILKCVYSFSV